MGNQPELQSGIPVLCMCSGLHWSWLAQDEGVPVAEIPFYSNRGIRRPLVAKAS